MNMGTEGRKTQLVKMDSNEQGDRAIGLILLVERQLFQRTPTLNFQVCTYQGEVASYNTFK